MGSRVDSLAHAWGADDATGLGQAIALYLPLDSRTNTRLGLLADAWQSEDSANLGRAIAEYLSEDFPSKYPKEDDPEISELRLENSRLRDRIDVMELELANLRNQTVFMQPPQEILRHIFDFVIPPPFLLDPSISYGPDSPWCQSIRAKMSLINVCWAWYNAAIDALYENIAFRNVCQVSALLRTLQNQTSLDFGQMIKEIGIHCFAPEGYSAVFRNDLNAVVAGAPRLSSVVLHTPWTSPLPVPLELKDIPSLAHLDCGPTVNYSDVHEHIGHLSHTLLSLSIHYYDASVASPAEAVHTFYHLETLRCPASAVSLISKRLILPKLKTLILQYSLKEAELGACLAFCKIFGQNIRTLSFWPVGAISSLKYYGSNAADIQPILEVCPRLEHLILPCALASSPDLSHSKIKWIDFWSMYNASFPNSIPTTNFPCIQGIRQLMVSGPLLFRHIPTVIPPHLNLQDPFEFDYPGFFLRHGKNRIYRNDAFDSVFAEYLEDEGDDGSDDEDDGSWNPSTSDDDTESDNEEETEWEDNDGGDDEGSSSSSTSDGESASGPGSDDSEESDLESEWEASHESVLALYDQLRGPSR
ncbi:hypothetical protein MVEN_00562800 [Mycena venus]|uniref:F-box domain-containing protein n=1 Tax=Mycena venus TaxID=2733690 RepID=A0A8H6YNZ3_9AGAR|nr:hypothetical protein MVEN_00562800 [Mycena venus]